MPNAGLNISIVLHKLGVSTIKRIMDSNGGEGIVTKKKPWTICKLRYSQNQYKLNFNILISKYIFEKLA